MISDELLFIDICKSFVKERKTTPSNLRLVKTLKKWLWHYPPPPPLSYHVLLKLELASHAKLIVKKLNQSKVSNTS